MASLRLVLAYSTKALTALRQQVSYRRECQTGVLFSRLKSTSLSL